jgi:hypothetical protein
MIRDLSELVAISGALSLAACSGDEAKESGDTAAEPTGGCPTTTTSGFAADYATNPDFFTLMAGPVDGGSVHGTVQIWYSVDLRELIEAGGPFVAPVGAVAVKAQNNGADAITVMTKQAAGFDPANGDWLYDQRDAAGDLQSSGALPSCIGCHTGWAATDYLAGTELR